MRNYLPWLCQGDVFERLPQIVVEMDSGGRVRPDSEIGASLLITHNCDLDKPARASEPSLPRIERLQFLPLRDIAQLDAQRQRLARAPNVNPPEVIYVSGPVTGVGNDAFGLLSEIYYLPARFFTLVLETYEHPEAELGTRHLTARRHQNRLGRLDQPGLELMRKKMAAFWPRFDVS